MIKLYEVLDECWKISDYVENAIIRSLSWCNPRVIKATAYTCGDDVKIEGIVLAEEFCRWNDTKKLRVSVKLSDLIEIENQYWFEEPDEFLYTEDVGTIEVLKG